MTVHGIVRGTGTRQEAGPNRGRLIRHRPALADSPRDDRGWCAEALASHNARQLSGRVIVTGPVKERYTDEPLVSRIDRLSKAPWKRLREAHR